jgi:hypothetical protein
MRSAEDVVVRPPPCGAAEKAQGIACAAVYAGSNASPRPRPRPRARPRRLSVRTDPACVTQLVEHTRRTVMGLGRRELPGDA